MPDISDLPDLLTPDEAADVWRISGSQVRRLIASGDCPAVVLSARCRRIPKAWVIQTLAESGVLEAA
jgi:excisionase family DNA binding protein